MSSPLTQDSQSEPIQIQSSSDDESIFSINFIFISLTFLIAFLGFGYILATLPGIAESPSYEHRTCITGGWKYALVLTHALTFGLIPLAMRIFYQALNNLKYPLRTIFASQLGLAFIMVAIAAEMGWHVTQCWYYQNQFTMLNFMFYFFLVSAFALWADGLSAKVTLRTHIVNIIFAISLLAVSILYKVGFDANDDPKYKIPIYIALTLVFGVLTFRGYQVLKDWKIILVPIFAVGVNLGFIVLLDKFGGDPYTNPQVAFNALFHILHDFAGTEAGVAIFTWLIYQKGSAPFNGSHSTS